MELIIAPTQFTPWSAAIGGSLIGFSAVLLMLTLGRTAGASTILGNLIALKSDGHRRWRLIFMVGVLIGAAVSGLFFFDPSQIRFPSGMVLTAAGGILVGVGVTLGSGCTSGHGICGLSRFSRRSLVATVLFMGMAIATVLVTRHVVGG